MRATADQHAPGGGSGGTDRPGRDGPGRWAYGLLGLGGLIVAVCAAVAVVHWPALSAQALAFDDDIYLTDNRLVQNPSWVNAWRFLTEVLEPSTVRGYYQPLTMISLMGDCALGGSADELRAFHRTSLALHVANTGLLIVLVYSLFGRAWAAAIVGLIFGVHPLTVEPIPWVGERKTLLAAFFVLVSLVAYVRFARRRGAGSFVVCLLGYALALMAKPTSTPLPVLMLLLDYWPLGRLDGRRRDVAPERPRESKSAVRTWERPRELKFAARALLEKLPLFAVGGVSAVVTYVSQARTAVAALPGEYSPWRIPLTVCHNIVFYLHKMLWPTNLTTHYPFPEPFTLGHPMLLIGVVGTAVLLVGLAWSLKYTRALAVGWLMFFVAIFPTLGVIGFTNVIASDKYAYLPSVGLLITLGWAVGRCWGPGMRGRVTVLAVAGLVVVGEGWGTRRYLAHWRTTEAFGRRIVEMAPRSFEARIHRAGILSRAGDAAGATAELERALELEPRYWKTHYNLAVMLAEQGRGDEAFEHYEQALRFTQREPELHNNMGGMLLQRGRVAEAIAQFEQAIRLQPDFAEAHNNLGAVLLSQKRVGEAIEHFERVLQVEPDHLVARVRLASALGREGKLDEAIEQYREVIRIDADSAAAHHDLGIMYVRQERYAEAVEAFRSALRLDPKFVKGYNNLGLALMRVGRPDEAIEAYGQALRLDAKFVSARINLGNALRVLERLDEAVAECRRAVELEPDNAAAHFTLGLTLEDAGRRDEAVGEYRRTLELEPKHPQARERVRSISH